MVGTGSESGNADVTAGETALLTRETMVSLEDRMKARVASSAEKASEENLSSLAARLAAVAQREHPAGLDDAMRVCGLPIISSLTDAEVNAVSKAEILADQFEDGFRLWRQQAEGVLTYDSEGGLFAPCCVGAGKSGILLLCAKHGHERGIEKSLLLVPRAGYQEMLSRHIPWARAKFGFNVPVHGLGAMESHRRKALAASGRWGLYVLPYSCLSTKDTDEVLRAVRPGLVIADEAHELRGRKSAKVKRFLHFMNETPWPQFVALSGTVANKFLRDFHHLLWLALRHKMPLPISTSQTDEWGHCIDASADEHPPMRDQLELVSPLRDWAVKNAKILGLDPERLTPDVSGIRRAFRARLVTAPGVVATDQAEVGTTLVIANRPIEKPETYAGWARLQELMTQVTQFPFKTPSGDKIEHAIHTWKWMWELSAGFYNDLVWPSVPVLASRRKIPEAAAENLLKAAKDHHEARQKYARALRDFFDEDHVPGLDTPLLVGQELKNHGAKRVPDGLYRKWIEARDLDIPNLPERDENPIRVCDYKVQFAINWVKTLEEKTGAIIWVHNREMGEWVSEALEAVYGARILRCPNGPKHDAEILDPKNGNRIVVASIPAHGQSKNLQHFQHQLVIQWPRPAWIAEQMLGRTHRPGQEADTLTVFTINTTEFDHRNYAACLVDGIFQHSTSGRRKMIYANYDPLPKIYSSQFLHEHGFENQILSAAEERQLEDLGAPREY